MRFLGTSEPEVETEGRRERSDVVPPPARHEQRVVWSQYGLHPTLGVCRFRELFLVDVLGVHRRESIQASVPPSRLLVQTRPSLGWVHPHEFKPRHLTQKIIRLIRVCRCVTVPSVPNHAFAAASRPIVYSGTPKHSCRPGDWCNRLCWDTYATRAGWIVFGVRVVSGDGSSSPSASFLRRFVSPVLSSSDHAPSRREAARRRNRGAARTETHPRRRPRVAARFQRARARPRAYFESNSGRGRASPRANRRGASLR